MRYPAGTVFELEDKKEVQGWDPDERVRERMNYSGKEAWFLPDTGRGNATLLPANMTSPCPEEVFREADLRAGPCRVTAVGSGIGDDKPAAADLPCGEMRESDVTLQEIGRRNAQGLAIGLPPYEKAPRTIVLRDVLRGKTVFESPFSEFPSGDGRVALDFSALFPGFYELRIHFKGDCRHVVRFIKSFPLLVQFAGKTGRYTLHQTLY